MSELDEQIEVRRAKRQRLREAGIATYPHRFDRDADPAEVRARWGEASAADLEAAAVRLRVPGRVLAVRVHGKTAFVDLHDGREKLQLLIRPDRLSEGARLVYDNLDLGDFVGAEGRLIRTRTGELSLEVEELTLLAKALRPLPEKWHGLADVETRYRQRYLDLATNPESRQVFEVRAALISGIRAFLDRRGFLEVETPMMHLLPGGATARPFATHHNTLDLDLYLRIAPELFLKRLLVGGMPRVYEINRNFRNEGISVRHNPEFTMLEFYWAYADYRDLMELTEELVVELAEKVKKMLGKEALTWQGRILELARPWPRYTIQEAIVEIGGVDSAALRNRATLFNEFENRGLYIPASIDTQADYLVQGSQASSLPAEDGSTSDYANLLMALFEQTVEDKLFQPTFITGHPAAVSPLSKEDPQRPGYTERFEVYMGSMEIANAFSELNDPDVQAERFQGQLQARERGDAEAHLFDHDYIRALEHGMPPAGGEGIGIDRLTMLMTDRPSIRDVILFPLMRPEPRPEAAE
jgi:lysyl-tRNA synthetase class 2